MKNQNKIHRRQFIRRAGLGVALFNILPSRRINGAEGPAPSEQGQRHRVSASAAAAVLTSAEVAALGHNYRRPLRCGCEIRREGIGKYPNARRFTDYRGCSIRWSKEIEAVSSAHRITPTRSSAMEAMCREKHVYCEKPLAHFLDEVRTLMAARPQI